MFKKAFKEICIVGIVILVCLVLSGLLNAYNPELLESYFAILEFTIKSYVLVKAIKIASWFTLVVEKNQIKATHDSEKKHSTLFSWSGKGDIDQYYFFDLLKDKKKEDPIKNMKEIKKKLQDNIGTKLGDYYLFLGYIEHFEKNDLNKIMKAFLLGIITTIAAKIVVADQIVSFIYKKNDITQTEFITSIIDAGFGILFIIAIVIFVYNEFTREKRRISLYKVIIETIIREKKGG